MKEYHNTSLIVNNIYFRGSPECSSIQTLEQWYMIFSLLSAVSAGKAGRPFVWEALGYLIDNNLISTLNFSPCRHLVLRFLYRSYSYFFLLFMLCLLVIIFQSISW